MTLARQLAAKSIAAASSTAIYAAPPWPALAHVKFQTELLWLLASTLVSLFLLVLVPPAVRWLAVPWLAAEVAFWLFSRTRGSSTTPASYDHLDVAQLQLRFLHLGTNCIFDINQFLNAWFYGAPIDKILRGNVAELVAYGFYSAHPANLTPQQSAQVDRFVLDVQRTFHCVFPPGHNPSLRFLSHLWQPLRVWHKPLALYAVIEGCALLSSHLLQFRGFARRRHGGFDVYVAHAAGTGVPIVMLHGVGFGLLPYLPLLSDIRDACRDAPLIVVEAHHVSQRVCITGGARSVDDVAACVLEVLDELGLQHACMVAHSYGTFVISRLLHMRPKAVHSCVLADPVAMMICYPRLLQAFVYAEMSPRLLLSLRGWVRALRLLVSRDAMIAESFGRRFCWRALMLWAEDLPPRSLVAVGERDDLIPGTMIRASMRACGKAGQVLWLPNAVHGQVLLSSQRAALVHAVQRFCHENPSL